MAGEIIFWSNVFVTHPFDVQNEPLSRDKCPNLTRLNLIVLRFDRPPKVYAFWIGSTSRFYREELVFLRCRFRYRQKTVWYWSMQVTVPACRSDYGQARGPSTPTYLSHSQHNTVLQTRRFRRRSSKGFFAYGAESNQAQKNGCVLQASVPVSCAAHVSSELRSWEQKVSASVHEWCVRCMQESNVIFSPALAIVPKFNQPNERCRAVGASKRDGDVFITSLDVTVTHYARDAWILQGSRGCCNFDWCQTEYRLLKTPNHGTTSAAPRIVDDYLITYGYVEINR